MVDLRNTRVMVVVWAMPGCGACDEYLPIFEQRLTWFRKNGAPFHIWRPGDVLSKGQIPVMFYDAASDNEELQAFADRLGVSATPTTYVIAQSGSLKVEGLVPEAEIDDLLHTAIDANR
ncbi:MAG: thioredoxin fold domain-containing protein [Tepidisphaeraceae bacterium]